MKHALLALAAILLLAVPAAADQTLLLRQPDLSADHLAFVYAGDIWVAAPDGSSPRRLTTSPADENTPLFSPDGAWIAFNAAYENNRDVYVISVDGGQPRRLTWHPGGDHVAGWTPDGDAVAFVSNRETDHGRSGQLYHVPVDGGAPVKRMEARVFDGAYAADGRFAYLSFGPAYNGLFGASSGWKGYRGGTSPSVWVMDADLDEVVKVPGERVNEFDPFWLGAELYFLSDREDELFNLYRWDAAANAAIRVSDENVWDVRTANGHGTTVVYEAGGRLKALETTSGATREIVVSIDPDLPQLRPGWKNAMSAFQHGDISPTGKRVIVTARGEVLTVPVDEGSVRNVTNTGDVREYTALWSPDGGEVAWIADSLKGQRLVIADQDGMGETRSYELGKHFYELMAWGGDEMQRIVYADNHNGLFVIDPVNGDKKKVATNTRRAGVEVALSPDGDWLAYTQEQLNFYADLMLLNLDDGERIAVTDGLADAASPAFSRDGAYLYFAASTNSGPLQVGLNMESQERPFRAGLYCAVLAADGASPLLPESGDEDVADDEAETKDDDEEEKDEEEDEGLRIDAEGLLSRIIALPVAEKNYSNLAVGSDGALYYVQSVQPGASVEPPGSRAADENALMRFDMDDKEASAAMSGVRGFVMSADGKKMLIRQSSGNVVTADAGASIKPKPLSMGDLRVHVDPREEWTLIFDETWRMSREYFYDPDMHGLDWDAVYKRYRPLVDHVGRREDLNTLLVEMIAEMQVGHNRVGGGDVHRASGPRTGLLGANFTIEDGRWRVARVYDGETWNPFVTAPLATPGNEVNVGEYLLAVNGRDLTDADNLFERLQGTVGEQVTLRVGPDADGDDARDVVVEPAGGEFGLRLWRWVETNRRRVDEATGGRVGYIYLPNTAGAGYTFFNRMFYAQCDKDALIIDERSNGGGQAADYIVQALSRRHLSGWKDRDGLTYNTPASAVHGPKVMLIDQDAGSGGDYLPYAFRHLDIGTLVGTRTWGGLIGIMTNPLLVDGGFLTVPFFRFYDADGRWSVENEGVAPDIEVALDPILTNEGVDSQLDRAIVEVMDQLGGFRSPVPDEAPPYPTELGK